MCIAGGEQQSSSSAYDASFLRRTGMLGSNRSMVQEDEAEAEEPADAAAALGVYCACMTPFPLKDASVPNSAEGLVLDKGRKWAAAALLANRP